MTDEAWEFEYKNPEIQEIAKKLWTTPIYTYKSGPRPKSKNKWTKTCAFCGGFYYGKGETFVNIALEIKLNFCSKTCKYAYIDTKREAE